MTFYYPLLERPLIIQENMVNVLIIENPAALRRFLHELSEQVMGHAGSIVLGVHNSPAELSQYAVLVTDPLNLNLDSRKMAGKILQAVIQAAENRGDEIQSILKEINILAAELSLSLDFEATFTELDNPTELLKVMNFHLDSDSLEFPELLLEWMRLQRLFIGKSLFVFYGLKAYLDEDELQIFYRSVFYEKLNLLLVEPFQGSNQVASEQVTIIDKDLCILE